MRSELFINSFLRSSNSKQKKYFRCLSMDHTKPANWKYLQFFWPTSLGVPFNKKTPYAERMATRPIYTQIQSTHWKTHTLFYTQIQRILWRKKEKKVTVLLFLLRFILFSVKNNLKIISTWLPEEEKRGKGSCFAAEIKTLLWNAQNSMPRLCKVQYKNKHYNRKRSQDFHVCHRNSKTGDIPDWKTKPTAKHV